ncbi:MAG: hypothetical protein ACLQVA_02135 [Candidatus Brocadiia bacterium]
MKITHVLFVIVSASALTLGSGFAGAPARNRLPAVKKSAPALKDGIAPKSIEPPRRQAAFSPALRPSAAPTPNPAPRRGSSPASIGGPATSRAKSTAVIKGTEMRPRP